MQASATQAPHEIKLDGSHNFVTPVKKINLQADVEKFKQSQACEELITFLTALSKSCQTSKMTETEMADNLIPLNNYLEKLV